MQGNEGIGYSLEAFVPGLGYPALPGSNTWLETRLRRSLHWNVTTHLYRMTHFLPTDVPQLLRTHSVIPAILSHPSRPASAGHLAIWLKMVHLPFCGDYMA